MWTSPYLVPQQMHLQTLAVAWCYTDGLMSHTLPLGDLRETGEELAEDKSLQNSGSGDKGGMQT